MAGSSKDNPMPSTSRIHSSDNTGVDDGAHTDIYSSEFTYYSCVIRSLIPAFASDADRRRIVPWLDRLFAPEYSTGVRRGKRNRYLLQLTLTLLTDQLWGIFKSPPPPGPLPDLSTQSGLEPRTADWERDSMWEDTVAGLPAQVQKMTCRQHTRCPVVDEQTNRLLDEEFQLFLYLARPYAALLASSEERTKVATWMQVLCTVHKDACPVLKGIRNDYMQALLGYVHDLRVAGPFLEYPPHGYLRPLAEAARYCSPACSPTPSHCPLPLPLSSHADHFLRSQPRPTNGAFCYVVVTDTAPDDGNDAHLPSHTGPY